ncbi:hypothetical protein [Bacillus cereus]|uniref:hypothetical protein n=1 Tax=Bacillus cereus TaxID=1396 RepID=UPI003980252C
MVIYNKKSEQCKAITVQIKSVVTDYNNLPLENVKVYKDSITNKEHALSNSQYEFKFYTGVCGEITLERNIRKNMMPEHVPKSIQLKN